MSGDCTSRTHSAKNTENQQAERTIIAPMISEAPPSAPLTRCLRFVYRNSQRQSRGPFCFEPPATKPRDRSLSAWLSRWRVALMVASSLHDRTPRFALSTGRRRRPGRASDVHHGRRSGHRDLIGDPCGLARGRRGHCRTRHACWRPDHRWSGDSRALAAARSRASPGVASDPRNGGNSARWGSGPRRLPSLIVLAL